MSDYDEPLLSGDIRRSGRPDWPTFTNLALKNVAYAEIISEQKADTAVDVLVRAFSWIEVRGVTEKKIRSFRPRTDGKIERLDRTIADCCAFAQHFNS